MKIFIKNIFLATQIHKVNQYLRASSVWKCFMAAMSKGEGNSIVMIEYIFFTKSVNQNEITIHRAVIIKYCCVKFSFQEVALRSYH